MKYVKRLLVVAGVAASTLFVAQLAGAQQAAPMTDAHIQRILANCEQAGHTLTQLHASDALLRVNRGQLYDLISTKLMARMNSRLALNRLDASKLVSSSAAFDRALTEFRTNYQLYEVQLSATLRINCKKQPVAFYDAVSESRERRIAVHDSVEKLQHYIDEYNREFDTFRMSFQNKQKVNNT